MIVRVFLYKGYLGFLQNTKCLLPSELNNESLFLNDDFIQDYLNWLDVSVINFVSVTRILMIRFAARQV